MKCWECDKEGIKQFSADEYFYRDIMEDDDIEIASKRWYCDECYEKISESRKKDRDEYIRLKKKLMLERAIRMLEKQRINPYDYTEAYTAVKEFVEKNPDRFDSAHEMVAAMILIDNEIGIKTQYSVAGYRVDFYIPDLKAVLEIDGVLYHKHRKTHDNNRDIKIRQELGADFEIIRIDTKYIEQNAELLVEAIKAIRAERQKIRKAHHGILPSWYK